ncbi:MAG: hypothetical protein ACRDGS_02600 [Chloroflexota bacterium]
MTILALVAAAIFVAAHGVRAIAVLVIVVLIATLPNTRGYKIVERVLVRLTGSRRRSAVLVALIVIGAGIAINIYPLIHP